MATDFTWQDGERRIRFGRGAIADAPELLGEGYTLLTTPRAAATAPAVVQRAAAVHEVARGQVDAVAGALLDAVDGELLVALGGGRVVDVAKALAAARPGRTRRGDPHDAVAARDDPRAPPRRRRARRHAARATGDRPQRPRRCPRRSRAADLAASAANSLGHAVEAPLTTLASPVPTLAAHEAARLIARRSRGRRARPRRAGARGAAVRLRDRRGLVRAAPRAQPDAGAVGGAGHGPANAGDAAAHHGGLAPALPDRLAALDAAAGEPVEALAAAARRARRGRPDHGPRRRPRAPGGLRARRCRAARAPAHAAPAEFDELRALYTEAW